MQAGAVLYSNIGAGFPADTTTFYTTGAPEFGTTFVATASGPLASISMSLLSGGSVTGGLYTNFSGEPGTLLETWTFTTSSQTTLDSVLNPMITSGTEYWFVFANPNGTIGWVANDTSVAGGAWSGTSLTGLEQFVASSPAPGIELLATPEPGTLGMLAIALGLLSARLWWPTKTPRIGGSR